MNLPFICLLIKSINFKIYLFRNSLSFIKCRWFTISCSMFPLSLLWLRISWFVDCFTYLYNSEVGALLGQGWFELPISVQGGKNQVFRFLIVSSSLRNHLNFFVNWTFRRIMCCYRSGFVPSQWFNARNEMHIVTWLLKTLLPCFSMFWTETPLIMFFSLRLTVPISRLHAILWK